MPAGPVLFLWSNCGVFLYVGMAVHVQWCVMCTSQHLCKVNQIWVSAVKVLTLNVMEETNKEPSHFTILLFTIAHFAHAYGCFHWKLG